VPIAAQPEDPDLGRLAASLKQLRSDRGLTYEQLAEASGLSRRGVIALEQGERSGNLRSWYRVAAALDVPFSELMAALDK